MTNTWYVKTVVRSSPINGSGRFAAQDIGPGDKVLGIEGNIYKNENNSYVNHSADNNVDWDGAAGWTANRFIDAGEEITMDYTQWVKQDLPF